jgi:hypothetical protein
MYLSPYLLVAWMCSFMCVGLEIFVGTVCTPDPPLCREFGVGIAYRECESTFQMWRP